VTIWVASTDLAEVVNHLHCYSQLQKLSYRQQISEASLVSPYQCHWWISETTVVPTQNPVEFHSRLDVIMKYTLEGILVACFLLDSHSWIQFQIFPMIPWALNFSIKRCIACIASKLFMIANFGNVFYQTFTNVFYLFHVFLRFLTFFIFIWTFITSMTTRTPATNTTNRQKFATS